MEPAIPGLKRYLLEQDFTTDSSKPESYITAIVSVVGDVSLTDFERELSALSFDARRFKTLGARSGGRWFANTCDSVPEMVEGLILFSEQSSHTLGVVEREVQRYWKAGLTPLVGLPSDSIFAEAISRLMTSYDNRWTPVQFEKPPSFSAASNSDDFVERALRTIAAILLPGTYPGLVCLDTADMGMIYIDSRLSVVTANADQLEPLITMLESELALKGRSERILAVLYAPDSLKLAQCHEVMNAVRRLVQREDTTYLVSAIADTKRLDYEMYLVTGD